MGRSSKPGFGVILLCAALSAVTPRSSHADGRDSVWAGVERVEVASVQAHRGRWRMNASHYDHIDDPTVAMAEDGRIGVARADLARQNIYLQMYTPDDQARFAEPVDVSSHPGIFSWLPKMAMSSRHERHLWPRIHGIAGHRVGGPGIMATLSSIARKPTGLRRPQAPAAGIQAAPMIGPVPSS